MPDTLYVKMPQTDYVAIANAVRAKVGSSAAMTSGEVATQIAAIPTLSAAVSGTTLTLTGSGVNVNNGALNL